ncbi:hypothetical protein AGMMS4957_18610 [Bacteroidia bacterium]|nr:hypothetical protein AGMMS4957_18610 [Bacteroidia bacterium]
MLFRIVEHCMDVGCTVYSVKDSFDTYKKGDLVGTILLFAFGISAQIERDMIVKRTLEGIERRKREGVIFGRPVGSSGPRKLDGKEKLLQKYIDAGSRMSTLERRFKVNRATILLFIREKGLTYIPKKMKPSWNLKNPIHLKSKENDAKINPHKSLIVNLIDKGKTQTDMMKALSEKGVVVTPPNITSYMKRHNLWEYYRKTHAGIRKDRNKYCSKNKIPEAEFI